MGWYEDLYEDSWYEDGSFIILQEDPTEDGAQWFRVVFYGPEPAESYMQIAYVTKADLLGMRREINRALRQATSKEER